MRAGRARAGIVLLAALALASLSTSARGSPYHAITGQTDVSSGLEQVTETSLRVAQSFTPTGDFTLTRAALYVQDRGNSNPLTVQVVPDAGGVPNDGAVFAAGTNDTLLLYEWANFTLSPPVSVIAGTTYWIVADSSGGNGQGYAWRYTTADAYPPGTAATASGNSWTAIGGDMSFVLYGWTPATLTLSVTADRATARSGDRVEYTIVLTNTGTEDATDVWVNATFDGRLAVTNTSGPGAVSVAGGVVTFAGMTVPTGDTVLTIDCVAGTLFGDASFLALPVTVEYDDGTARRGTTATELVEILAPQVVAVITAQTAANPGDLVTFEVTVENVGREVTRHVWLNQSLHPALTFLDATVPPDQSEGQQLWHLADLVGPETFTITVQVDPRAAPDTVVANYLSIDFTDGLGQGRVRDKSNTIFVRLGGAASNPWLWGSFVISATIVGGTYLGYVRRRLRTEEIFLIHHSGVLLVHMSKSLKADHDSDIVSGMLTAILNFVRDAFHYDEKQELQGLDLGRYRVHVRKGGITYLALVYKGRSTRWLAKAAARAVFDIESEWGAMLRQWDGDLRALTGVREILKGHFLSPTGPSRSWAWFRSIFARLDQTFKPMRPL